jgi:hypothetical protein
MAKINDGTLKDWKNGDKLTSDLYEADREILRVANNDNHDRIVTLEVDKPVQDKRLDDLEYNVTGTVVPMTFKELGMQNLTFDDIKLGYVDKAIEKAWKPSLDTLTRGIVEESIAAEGQTVVNLTNSYTPGSFQLTVEVDGVPQGASSYTETSTTSITLSEALVAGQKVTVTIGKVQPSADARFSSMGTEIDGLTSSLADKVNFTDLAYTDVTQPLGTVSKKIVRKVSTSEYGVFSRKPSKSGCTYMRFAKDNVVAADAQNAGGSAELVRLIGVYDVTKALAYNRPSTITSSQLSAAGTNDFQTANLATDYASPSTPAFYSNSGRNVANAYLEFVATIKKSHNGVLDLAFLGTASSCVDLEILINGVVARTGVNLSATPNQIKIIPLDVSNYIGDITVRLHIPSSDVTTNVFHFLGYNAHDIAELTDRLDYNNIVYTLASSNNYITQSSGANEYALFETGGKWMGSFHGAETSLSLSVLLDGADCTGMAVGTFMSGKKFEINQSTNINNKITTRSITRVLYDSVYEFDCYFDIQNPLSVDLFYTCMTCSNTDFSNVIFPVSVATTSGDTALPNLTKVSQENPTTKQQIITIFTPNKRYKGSPNLFVRYTANAYCKVYHGKTVNSQDTLNSMGFGNMKIFD